jgi:hypothetical protein
MIKRRKFCESAMSAAILAGATALPSMSLHAKTLDPNNGPDLMHAFRKMRYVDGSGMSIGWLRAKRFAVSQGRIEPMCGMLAAAFSQVRKASDDLIEVVTMEVTHYTDFESGELLETLVMPFTGKEVVVPPFRSGPALSRTALLLNERETYAPRKNSEQGAFAPAGEVLMTKSLELDRIEGGDLYLRHEEFGRVYPEDAVQPSLFYRESTVWSAPLDEALDSARPQVDSTVFYTAMTSWRPWMKVGDLSGHTASNGIGHRARTIDDLPDDFLRFTRQAHPGVLENASTMLDTFEGSAQ